MPRRDQADVHSGDGRSPSHEYGYDELALPVRGRRWADDELASRVSSSLADACAVGETTDLATLHRLAVEADEVLRQIKSDGGLLLDGVPRPSGPCRAAAVPDLENQHARLRDLITQRSRPHLRPLRLQDLPPEILASVVANCERGGAWAHEEDPGLAATVAARPPGDVAAIRNLRLTCRVLADLAAPHLVRVVDVAMTPASLAKLDAVSRHPTIGGGVLRVRVGLAWYPAQLKTDRANFVHFALRSLLIEATRDNRARELCEADRAKHRARMVEWRRYEAEPPFLVQAFAEYQRRCDEYEAVRAGFGDAVARAVARMRNATRVEVNDKIAQDRRDEWHTRHRPRRETDPLVDEQALSELLALPMRWEHAAAYGWGDASDHPVEALRELLVSLGRRDVGLTRLVVSLTPPVRYHGLACTGAEREHITKAVRELRSAVFEVKPTAPAHASFDVPTWPPRGPEELEGLGTFMSAALASEKLVSVTLDFGALRRENQDLWTLATLLKSAPQNWRSTLSRLDLQHPCLSASDLETLVGERVAWFGLHSPHLTEGSWADVLDMLRGRADPKRRDRDETPMEVEGLTQPTGGETETMTGAQYNDVFSRPGALGHFGGSVPHEEQLDAVRRPSPAMQFVSHLLDENPVRSVI